MSYRHHRHHDHRHHDHRHHDHSTFSRYDSTNPSLDNRHDQSLDLGVAPGSRRKMTASAAPAVVASAILLAIAFIAPVQALDNGSRIFLTTGNDLLAGNPFDDDLYTASLTLSIEKQGLTYQLEERMFTDKDARRRFDETWLTVSSELPVGSRWWLRSRLGAVHVGRGLIGESGQNAVHRLIGDDEVDLTYIDQDRVHAVAGVDAIRPLWRASRTALELVAEAQQAVGFGRHVQLGLQARHDLGWVEVHWESGYRWSSTRQELLRSHLRDGNMTLGIGVVLLDRYVLDWTYNRYGTGTRHVTLGYRLPMGGGGRRTE